MECCRGNGPADVDHGNGFEHSGWAMGAGDNQTRALITETYQRGDALLSGDLAAAMSDLKATPAGELQVHGSGTRIRWLLENDLVDVMTLRIVPVVLGQGARLFPRHRPGHRA